MEPRFLKRIETLRGSFAAAGIDALMVRVEENRRYLCGFTGEDSQMDESAGTLFVTADRLLLATDSRFVTQVETECPGLPVYCYRKQMARELPDILAGLSVLRLGFEDARLSVAEFTLMEKSLAEAGNKTALVAVRELAEKLRLTKDESEISAIGLSLFIAEQAFLKALSVIRPGMTEKQAAWELEKAMREEGADSLSFPVIAAAGENAAMPHAIPGHRVIRAGEPVLFDWGARKNGYCSDISRTVFFGRPDDTFRKVFDAVREAQSRAQEAVRPGAEAKALDHVARSFLDSLGFGDKFGHGLGHGVGLAVHEAPRLSPLSEAILAPGMIATIEPGVYLPGLGGVRLENMVAVTETGARVLNSLPPAIATEML
ncbi:MAG: aminopeptidase P family protein [Thermodesulfobacteriota bacterium]